MTIKWSEYQEAVFDAIDDPDVGNIAVEARAGSAKTTTIVEGLSWVPQRDSVLLGAFNKGIERELSEKAPGGVEVRTLHSFGFGAVRSKFHGVRLEKNKTRKLCGKKFPGLDRRVVTGLCRAVGGAKNVLSASEEEIWDMITRLQIDMGIGMPPKMAEKTPKQIYEWAVAQKAVFVKRVAELLEASAAEVGEIDFDDMVWLPIVRELRLRKFDWLFIDEWQDLNQAQHMLVDMSKGGRLVVVGDPKQAIYKWRGAVGTMSVPNAEKLPLPICYRCGASIVRQAQRWVKDIQPWAEAEEGLVDSFQPSLAGSKTTDETFDNARDHVVEHAQYGDVVLSRTNAALVKMLMGFIQAGKHARILGRDFGTKLSTMVRDSDASSTKEFRKWLDKWRDVEAQRAKEEGTSDVYAQDLFQCLATLSEGASTTAEVRARIESYFTENDDLDRVLLSTVHKAKGLEWDRVFVLMSTFFGGEEEDNLRYVAVTRAKKYLMLAYG